MQIHIEELEPVVAPMWEYVIGGAVLFGAVAILYVVCC
jgi:hypothetical protein